MSGIVLDQPVSISNVASDPLEVELMTFKLMPNRRAVSLSHPSGAFSPKCRLINITPQTALNLLAWLESAKETLEVLVEEGKQS